MRPDFSSWRAAAWRIFTGSPAGSATPPRERVWHLLPLLAPLLAAAAMTGWNHFWREPRFQAVRAAHHDVLHLEQEVATLGLTYSDQQVTELASTAAARVAELGSNPSHLRQRLPDLEAAAANHGWSAQFDVPVAIRSGGSPEPAAPLLGHTMVRAQLTPLPDNPDRLGSLFAFLEGLSANQPRIDLIQLAISADERGWQGVEVHFRTGHRFTDAKSPQ